MASGLLGMWLYFCHFLTWENLSHQLGTASPQPIGSRAGEMEERGGFLEQLLTSLPLELLMCTPLPQLLPEETLGTYALEFTRGTMNYYHVMSYGSPLGLCCCSLSCVQMWRVHVRATWRKARSPCFLPTHTRMDMHTLPQSLGQGVKSHRVIL